MGAPRRELVQASGMADVLRSLEQTVRERLETLPDGSYCAELFGDPEKLLRKIMEEAFEVTLELGRAPAVSRRVVEEAADLVFHLIVGLASVDVTFGDVLAELDRRRR